MAKKKTGTLARTSVGVPVDLNFDLYNSYRGHVTYSEVHIVHIEVSGSFDPGRSKSGGHKGLPLFFLNKCVSPKHLCLEDGLF